MATMTIEKKKAKAAIVPEAERAPALEVGVPFVASTKYAQRDIHMTLDGPQAVALRSVFEALEERHAKLNKGAPVQNPQDAIRWLIEEVARVAAR